jgi:hypothetical protein
VNVAVDSGRTPRETLFSYNQLRIMAVVDPLTVGVMLAMNALTLGSSMLGDLAVLLAIVIAQRACALLVPGLGGRIGGRILAASAVLGWLHARHRTELQWREAKGQPWRAWWEPILFFLLVRLVVALAGAALVLTAVNLSL